MKDSCGSVLSVILYAHTLKPGVYYMFAVSIWYDMLVLIKKSLIAMKMMKQYGS